MHQRQYLTKYSTDYEHEYHTRYETVKDLQTHTQVETVEKNRIVPTYITKIEVISYIFMIFLSNKFLIYLSI